MKEGSPAKVSTDPKSLENLHDIVVPDPAPWWPPATGWYLLGSVIGLLTLLWITLAAYRWWSRRYRQAAIAELNLIRQRSSHQTRCETIHAIDRLLKRVALAGWPRESVANLSGDRWLSFLRRTSNGIRETATKPSAKPSAKPSRAQPSSQGGRQARIDWSSELRDLVYSKRKRDAMGPKQLESLFTSADHWIRTHSNEHQAEHCLAEDRV